MRISDWSSDVCSSDPEHAGEQQHHAKRRDIHRRVRHIVAVGFSAHRPHILNHRILMGCAVSTGLVVKGGFVHHEIAPNLRLISSAVGRSEEHTSELQSLMRISYAVFCLKKKNRKKITYKREQHKQNE